MNVKGKLSGNEDCDDLSFPAPEEGNEQVILVHEKKKRRGINISFSLAQLVVVLAWVSPSSLPGWPENALK